MLRPQLLAQITWRSGQEAQLDCFSPLFGKNVEIRIATDIANAISDRTIQIINDFLALPPTEMETIKGFLWEDCELCCEEIACDEIPEGMTETEANHHYYGVFGPEDAYRKSNFRYLYVSEYREEYTGNYGCLPFDNEWNSHLTTIVMRNGKIVGYGDSGIYLGQFEPD